MSQYINEINNDEKGSALISFLKQLDFIKIRKRTYEDTLNFIAEEIKESYSEAIENKTSSWKNKSIKLKDL